MRRWWYPLAVLAAVAVVALGAVIAITSYRKATSPEGVVRSYFAALAAGDAKRAISYSAPVPAAPNLLRDDVLRVQDRLAPIRGLTVDAGQVHGSTATVHARYVLAFTDGSSTVNDTITLAHTSAGWRLTHAGVPVTLTVGQAVAHAQVAGYAVPHGEVLVFPGALPVTFDTPLLQLDADTRMATWSEPPTGTPLVAVSQAGRDAVLAAVVHAEQQCLTAAHPDLRCPLPDARTVPGTLHGEVDDTQSKVEVLVATAGAALLTITGSVHVRNSSYTTLNFNNQPVPRGGPINVLVGAQAYAANPVRIVWTAP